MAEFVIDPRDERGPLHVAPRAENRILLAWAYAKGFKVEWEGEYGDYLQTAAWRDYRERILERDGRRCRLCANSERLTVHHSSYSFIGAERDQDVVTLCEPCHFAFHKWKKRPKLIGAVIAEARSAEKKEREHSLPLGSPSD